MPQAYITSPRRSHELPATGQKRSPKSRRSGRSSRLTSPVPLSPKELADYILERGNNATSPIIAKMVLDQQLDSRALAEFADESDSEDRLTSMSVLRDRTLVDDFLRTTSRLRHQLPSMDVVSSARPSLMEIATRLDNVEFSAVSPSSSAPAFQTPQLSPSTPFIPEWDLEDPDTPEELEIFAPRQGTVDDSDDDSLRSPILRNFRVSETTPLEDSRGMYSSLLRPVPPFTPETMPLLSALDMRHTPYGISPSSSQGGDVGLGDHPANAQGGLPNRQISPEDVRGGEHQARITECNEVLPVPRVSRTSSRQSIFENTAVREHSPRSSSCPPRAVRPHIIIPDTFWQPPPKLQRQYVDAEVQTEEPIPLVQPLSATIEIVSDAEDPAFFDAKDSHSATESVRDTDEEDDNLFVASQVGEEEHASKNVTPRPLTSNLPTDTPTSRVVTPMVSAPALPSVVIPAVQRLKSEHGKSGPSTAAPPLARTSSESSRDTRTKGPSLPSINTKLALRSQPPKSAPPQPAPKPQPLSKSAQNPKPNTTAHRMTGSNSLTSKKAKAKEEAEAKVKKEAEAKAKAEAEAKVKAEAEAKAKAEAEAKAKAEAEAKAKAEAEAEAKAEAEAEAKAKAKEEARAQKVAGAGAQVKATRISASKIQPAPSLVPERQLSETDSAASGRLSGTQAEGGASGGEPTGSTEPTESIGPITSVDTVVAKPLKNGSTNGTADVEPPEPVVTKTSEKPGPSTQQDADSGNVAADGTTPQSVVFTAPKESGSSTRQDADTVGGDAEETGAITIDRDPEANNDTTSRLTVTESPVIVVTSADSGETMSIDELNSGSKELLESALSSSVLPDSTNYKGLSSVRSEEELKESKALFSTAGKEATADDHSLTIPLNSNSNPDPTSAPTQSTENLSGATGPPPCGANAGNTVSAAAQETSTSHELPTSPNSSTSEITGDYTEIKHSDGIEPFAVIDKSEAVRTDGQDNAEIDTGNPRSDEQGGEALTVNSSAEPKKNSQTESQARAESNGENGGQQEKSTNSRPAKSAEDEDRGEPKKPQVRGDSAATDVQTENVESTQKSSADPGTPASDDNTQTQQVTEPVDSQGEPRPMSPSVARVRATDGLERDNSQETNSQAEADTDVLDDDDDNAGLSEAEKKRLKNQKKREREKKKKQLKASGVVTPLPIEDQVKSAADELGNRTLANPAGVGGAQKQHGQGTSKNKQDSAVVKKTEVRKKEDPAKQKEVKREGAGGKGAEEINAAETITTEQEGMEESGLEQSGENEAELQVKLIRQLDKDAKQRRQQTPGLPVPPVTQRSSSDLEKGETTLTPVLSPGPGIRQASDLESQNAVVSSGLRSGKRGDSPSSTHSKSSGGLLGAFRGFSDKLGDYIPFS